MKDKNKMKIMKMYCPHCNTSAEAFLVEFKQVLYTSKLKIRKANRPELDQEVSSPKDTDNIENAITCPNCNKQFTMNEVVVN